jgi:hypothetical protein
MLLHGFSACLPLFLAQLTYHLGTFYHPWQWDEAELPHERSFNQREAERFGLQEKYRINIL